MTEKSLEQAKRENMRWRILVALNAGRPYGVLETVLWRVLNDIELFATISELRRELDYLRDKELVNIQELPPEDVQGGQWTADLSPDGVDVVEYTLPCPAGIARPPKYWT